jgi:hypothetical protein
MFSAVHKEVNKALSMSNVLHDGFCIDVLRFGGSLTVKAGASGGRLGPGRFWEMLRH